MIAIITVFIFLHLIAFVVYASFYSSTIQEIGSKRKRLLIKNIDKEKIHIIIAQKEIIIKKNKRYSFIAWLSISALHGFFIFLSNKTSNIDFLYMTIVSLVFFLLLLLIDWMKGAGTIDSNPRFPGFTRM